MPSNLHEMLLELFRARPSLAPELLSEVLGRPLPEFGSVRLEPADCTDVAPTEYRSDAVVVLSDGHRPVLAVVVEVQLGRDGDKRWTWPVYVATLRARLRCPTELLVVCADAAVAGWCAVPIALGLGSVAVEPLVLGPDLIPVVTAIDRPRRSVELVVLSALAHGAEPEGRQVLAVLLESLSAVETEHAFGYLGLVYAALPVAARRHLEELMSISTDGELSELAQFFVAKGEEKGRAEGRAAGVLAVIDARGVPVTEDVRLRILGCTDVEQLDDWMRRAATATAAADLGL